MDNWDQELEDTIRTTREAKKASRSARYWAVAALVANILSAIIQVYFKMIQ